MNKTININLGGVFFHIDETAYKKLKKYLDAIRRSLSDDPKGKDEILNDIESRIGELLAETVKDVRQVVNEQDIDSIIIVMGKPEDYAGDEEFFDQTSTSYSNTSTKKLYRDTNDRFLGGVSSGLAHYFGIDVIWIRLAWIVMFFSGFGVLLYPILWILLPAANSTAEKLEMEGEAVNISNIERKIREEFEKASDMVKDGIDDVSEHLKKKDYKSKVKSGSQEMVSVVGRIFTVLFTVIGKFIGILLLFVAGVTLLALIVSAFSVGSLEILGFQNSDYLSYPPFFYNSVIPTWLLSIFVFVAVIIPFVVLFMLGLKILSSNVRSFGRSTKLALLGIWLIALFGLIFAGIEFGTKFSREKSVSQKQEINMTQGSTITIKMLGKDRDELGRTYGLKTIMDGNDEKILSNNLRIDIKESNTNKTYLKIYKKANGPTTDVAEQYANDIEYEYSFVNNELVLNNYFLSELKNKFQNQSVRLVLYVANNDKLFLDESTEHYLRYVDDADNLYHSEMVGHYFKMTPSGLDCMDCKEEVKEVEVKKIEENVQEEKAVEEDEIIEVKPNEAVKENEVEKTTEQKDSIPSVKKAVRKNKHVVETEDGLKID